MVLFSVVDGYSQANEYKNEEEDDDACLVYPEVCDEDCVQLDEAVITLKGDDGGDGEEKSLDLGDVDEAGWNTDEPNPLDSVLLQTTNNNREEFLIYHIMEEVV